ncbi:AMIN domain-containing protein, partial [Candidatus Binatia bacterium]|nr:AMIN domain-containing protein [Candidatus Binatia bacterium]
MRLRSVSLLLASLATLALALVARANDGATSLGAPGRGDKTGRAIIERVAWETSEGKARLVIGVRGVADYTARATGADPGGSLPDRAYVDLRPAVLGKDVSRTPLAIDDGLAKQVRVGQFDPQTVRVVVDLAAPGMFEVRTSEKPPRLMLSVVPRPPREAAVARAQGAMPDGGVATASPPPTDQLAAGARPTHAPPAAHAPS